MWNNMRERMTHTGQRTAPNKIGFLGCGHMGRAILSGLLARDVVSAPQIHVSARSSALATAERFGVNAGAPHELLERCDVLILAIKPQQLSALRGWVTQWREMFDASQRAPPSATGWTSRAWRKRRTGSAPAAGRLCTRNGENQRVRG